MQTGHDGTLARNSTNHTERCDHPAMCCSEQCRRGASMGHQQQGRCSLPTRSDHTDACGKLHLLLNTHRHTFEQNTCVISHSAGPEVCWFIIYKDYIKYAAIELFCPYVFCLRDHRGSMLGLTNPSSPSPLGLPARCGASPGTVLPFTEAPSQPRVLQVGWI